MPVMFTWIHCKGSWAIQVRGVHRRHLRWEQRVQLMYIMQCRCLHWEQRIQLVCVMQSRRLQRAEWVERMPGMFTWIHCKGPWTIQVRGV